MKDALDGKVKEIKVSTRLKDHPVCLSADGPLSIEMEKVLSKQPGSEGVKSDKVLELNVNHPVFACLLYTSVLTGVELSGLSGQLLFEPVFQLFAVGFVQPAGGASAAEEQQRHHQADGHQQDGIQPVSYTHLDVYKRQVPGTESSGRMSRP